MERELKIGSHVVFIDSQRIELDALVTAVWGPQCCNVLYVSADSAKVDPYGRQVERQTSIVHASLNSALANCFRFPDEA